MKKNNLYNQIIAFLFIFLLLSSNVYASVFQGSSDNDNGGMNEAGGDNLPPDTSDSSSEPVYAQPDPVIEAIAIAAQAAGDSHVSAETVEAATAAVEAAIAEAVSSGASEQVAQEAAIAAARVIIEGGSSVEAAQVASAIITSDTSVADNDNRPTADTNQQGRAEATSTANQVQVNTDKSDSEQAKQATKGIKERTNQEIRNKLAEGDPDAKKTLIQRAVEFFKNIPKRVAQAARDAVMLPVNIVNAIRAGDWGEVARLVTTTAVTVAGLLLGAPPGLTTAVNELINRVVDQNRNFNNIFPNGVPPLDVSTLSPAAAEALANKLRSDGNTVQVHTETIINNRGETQIVVTSIQIIGAGEGESRSTQVNINGITHTVTISGDGTGVSVSAPSQHPEVNFLQPGWDFGAFSPLIAPVCGDGNIVLPEQCEIADISEILSNPSCPNPLTCSGRLTAVVPPFAACIDTCQCLYDVPSVDDWQYIVDSCGAECNATNTINCLAGEVCSNGECTTSNFCGNGVVDIVQGEECDTGLGAVLSCAIGEICNSCQCISVTTNCNDGMQQVGEVCDTGIPSQRIRFTPPVAGNIGICRAACEDCICSGGTSNYGHIGTPTSGQIGVGPALGGEACQAKNLDGNYDLARDEDCDGGIDEGCACAVGDTRACGERGGACGIGGTQTCVLDATLGEGRWGVCTGTYQPQNEICNGIDDDCDLEVDECGCQNFFYFNRAFWESYDGLSFSPVSTVSVNNTVYLTVDTNLTYGAPVNLTIYESDCSSGNLFATSCSQKVAGLNTTITNSLTKIGKIDWNVSDQVIASTSGAAPGGIADGLLNRTFFFIANTSGQTITSSMLFVDLINIITPPGSCNIDIVTGVGKLNHRGIYFANKSIEFNQSRVGENVNVQWVIEGENEPIVNKNEKSFVMNFSRAGQKTITLNANIPGCAEQNRQVSILVTDGPGLFTYINAPFHKQVFKFATDTISVNYRGNESYVIQSSGSSCPTTLPTVTCLAGNCPSSTSNVPVSCSGNGITLTNTLTGDKFTNINFSWSRKINGNERVFNYGNGSANASGSINYNRANDKSNAIGDKQIKLIANYTVGVISLQNTFLRNFTLGTCIANGYQRLNVDSLGRVKNITNTRESGIACGNSGGDGFCCPVGEICGTNGCIQIENPITTCSNYTLRDDCLSDPYSAKEFEYSSFAQRNGLSPECNVNYNCVWNQTACNFNITQVDNLGNFGGSCLESAIPVVDSSCDNGELTKLINITSTSSGQLACLTCQSGVFEVPCGRPSIELPFFGIQQIVLSLISIIGLYLFLFRRRVFRK